MGTLLCLSGLAWARISSGRDPQASLSAENYLPLFRPGWEKRERRTLRKVCTGSREFLHLCNSAMQFLPRTKVSYS